MELMGEERGCDQSRTEWVGVAYVDEEGSTERFWVRTSEASGRSVSMTCEIWGSSCESVMPTIPHPAPSSRTLSSGCESAVLRMGSSGSWYVGEEGDQEQVEVRYAESTSPASLLFC